MKFIIEGMTCEVCRSRVEKAVAGLRGAKNVEVNLLTNSMTAELTEGLSAKEVIEAVEKIGYGAKVLGKNALKDLEEGRKEKLRRMKRRLITSVAILIPLMTVCMGTFLSGLYKGILESILCLAIIVINKNYFKSGFKALFSRAPNMDSLVALGSGTAFVFSLFQMFAEGDLYFEGSAMIVTLITFGKFLEERAKAASTNALTEMANLRPKTARLKRGEEVVEASAEDLRPNDIIIVAPKERIPADGVVMDGVSMVDESYLTGESSPQPKKTGFEVKAGSLNGNGALTLRVTKDAANSSLARVMEVIAEAAATKPRIAHIADKVSGIFVPTVITLSIVTFLSWFIINGNASNAISMAVSVLVISCPCALGLATPVAVMVGTLKAAKHNMLIKNSEVLENAAKTTIVAFDKTGTLTEGKATVKDFIKADNKVDEKRIIGMAAGLEMAAEHPLALAVRIYAKSQKIEAIKADNVEAVFGRGVKGVIGGKEALFGSLNFMISEKVDTKEFHGEVTRIAKYGGTPLIFAEDKKILGIFHIEDSVKRESAPTIKLLKEINVTPIIMTGDTQFAADALARSLNVDQAIGSMLPETKAKEVRRLEEKANTVMMTGDGINDAPALFAANVAVAMGKGAEVAAEAADVIFIKNDLLNIVNLITLSREVIKTIKTNLFWAFIYNVLAIPIAAGVFYNTYGLKLTPAVAAVAMSCSSLFVVLNSLRLQRTKLIKNDFTKSPDKVYDEIVSSIKREAIEEDFTKSQAKGALESDVNKEVKQTALESNVGNSKEENLMKTTEVTLNVKGMMCEHCKAHVTKALSGIDGVEDVNVDLSAGTALVKMSKKIETAVFKKAIEDAGYDLVS